MRQRAFHGHRIAAGMDQLAFIADTPTILGKPDSATSRVQIAKTGKFKDPRYGEFSITTKDFAKWMANFQALSLAGGRAGLPVDVDHGPEKTGNTEAAGWVTDLDTLGQDGATATPDQLWATVEWNTLGVELVGERRYLYLSPSYQHDFKDEAGRSHGTALVGVGLTNRPFLSMATVSLSAATEGHAGFAVAEVEPPADSRRGMKTLLSKLGLPDDATEEQALAALAKLQDAPTPEPQKTLNQLASEAGVVVLSAEDHKTLATQAASGAAAAAELHEQKFTLAWDKALDAGTVTPAEKDTQKELYGVAPAQTLAALAARTEPVVNRERRSQTGDDVTLAGADAATRRDADGHQVDPAQLALHNRALVLARDKSIDYAEAVVLAIQEG